MDERKGMKLIAQERQNQIEKCGFSLEFDKGWTKGQLLEAAYFSIHQAELKMYGRTVGSVPWPKKMGIYFKRKIEKKSVVEQYTVAGALFWAENDRTQSHEWDTHINVMASIIDILLNIIN